ncbi:hypothetical protein ACWKWU_00640 [Chitinophaga lutea]
MKKRKDTRQPDEPGSIKDWEGNDKAPGEEEGVAEKVTKEDLTGKEPLDPLDIPEKDQRNVHTGG